MSLMELIEHCRHMLGLGKSKEDCQTDLTSKGVHPAVQKAILATMNDTGCLLKADGTLLWGETGRAFGATLR